MNTDQKQSKKPSKFKYFSSQTQSQTLMNNYDILNLKSASYFNGNSYPLNQNLHQIASTIQSSKLTKQHHYRSKQYHLASKNEFQNKKQSKKQQIFNQNIPSQISTNNCHLKSINTPYQNQGGDFIEQQTYRYQKNKPLHQLNRNIDNSKRRSFTKSSLSSYNKFGTIKELSRKNNHYKSCFDQNKYSQQNIQLQTSDQLCNINSNPSKLPYFSDIQPLTQQLKLINCKPNKSHDSMTLINQLQQQNIILKKQLRQFQFQNQLLKEKISFIQNQKNQLLQKQNTFINQFQSSILKDFQQQKYQLHFQLQQKQNLFQHKFVSLTKHVQAIQNQKHSLQLQIQNLLQDQQIFKQEQNNFLSLQSQYQSNQQKNILLIQHLSSQIKVLLQQNQLFENNLRFKQQKIKNLQNQLEFVYFNDPNKNTEKIHNIRRKSLDLSTQARKIVFNQQSLYNSENFNDQQKYQRQNNKQKSQIPNKLSQNIENHQIIRPNNNLSRTDHVGKLMNKTDNGHFESKDKQNNFFATNKFTQKTYYPLIQKQNQNQSSIDKSSQQKYLNFVYSIKSMYTKVMKKQNNDLKQIWKWLKHITHQYQNFNIIYNFKAEIAAVLDDLQTRNTEKSQYPLSFMDKQCLKIIQKLTDIVQKHHS